MPRAKRGARETVVNLVILVGWVSWRTEYAKEPGRPQFNLKVEAGDRIHRCRMWDDVAKQAIEDEIEEGELIYIRGRIASEQFEVSDEALQTFPYVLVDEYRVLTPPSMRHDA